MTNNIRFSSIAALLACTLFFTGCGPDRPDTVPVSGKVTFAGGPPPAAGSIQFATLEPAPGFDRRPTSADFDAGGNYETEAFEGTKGLVPGTYRVRVDCWKIAPTMDKPVGVSYIDEKFTAPDLNVPVGGSSITHNVDVTPAAN